MKSLSLIVTAMSKECDVITMQDMAYSLAAANGHNITKFLDSKKTIFEIENGEIFCAVKGTAIYEKKGFLVIEPFNPIKKIEK